MDTDGKSTFSHNSNLQKKDDDLLSDLNDKPPYDFLASDENEIISENVKVEKMKDFTVENNLNDQIKNGVKSKSIEMESENPEDSTIKRNSKKSEFVEKVDAKKNIAIEAPLRRSRRSNKGVGKEIFDPSYIPVKKSVDHDAPSPRSPSPTLPPTSQKKDHHAPKTSKSPAVDSKVAAVKRKFEKFVKTEGKEKVEKTKFKADEEDDIPLKKLGKIVKKEQEADYLSEEDVGSSSEDSDDSYNDPGRLWCICQQPHNNRFMISCDDCEDWFHGDCVGISLQKGKRMEQENAEYVCPNCIKKQEKLNSNPKRDSTKKKNNTQKKPQPMKLGRNLKGYAHATKHRAEHDEKDSAPSKKLKSSGEDTTKKHPSGKRKCIVKTCEKEAQLGSIYCSNQCILLHAKQSLKAISKEKEEKKDEQRSRNVDASERISVICRKTKKVIRGPAAPKRKDLSSFLKTHPSYTVYRPSLHKNLNSGATKPKDNPGATRVKSSMDFYKHVAGQNRKRDCYGVDPDFNPKDLGEENEVKKTTPPYNSTKYFQQRKQNISKAELINQKVKKKISKHEDQPIRRKSIDEKSHKRKSSVDDQPKKLERSSSSSSQSNENEIRSNIRKSLRDILKMRSTNSDDLKMHSDSILKLSKKIEDSLFKHFGETNTKYKNKYRSMMFNLKDARNHGLWRKVIIGEVTASELVQMTAEQMASKKLAEWRERELTQELDLIKKEEKQKANVRPISKITHKGEIAIREDFSDLTETNVVNRKTLASPTLAPVRIKRNSITEEETFDFSNLPPDDTTLSHKEHLFHHNCKICTGKVKEEDVDFPEEVSKKVKSSSSIILSSEAQLAASVEKSPIAPVSQIKLSHPLRSKQEKAKRRSSDAKSHDASLSPSSFLKDISSEKKKKIVLPKPPPLSDILQREEVSSSSKPAAKPDVKTESPKMKKIEEKAVVKTIAADPIWSGFISMLELSTFKANIYAVSDNCEGLELDLPTRLVLGGRIHPKVVWEYLDKVRLLPTKELSIVRFHAANIEDRDGYVAMLSYFSSRKRFGVVNNQDRMLLKDMYIIPLLDSQPIPSQLLTTPGVEFPPNRHSMLLGVIVRHALKETTQPVLNNIKEKSKIEQDSAEEEYIPEDIPILEVGKSTSVPYTEEELGEKKKQRGISLFDRNKSLTPSTPFFMRSNSSEKQTNEASLDDDTPYSPTSHLKDCSPVENKLEEDDDEKIPYDPMDNEEYDPETSFAHLNQQNEDDAPYDPEENLIDQSMNVDELVEKQAFLEKMQKELEEKKAKLFEVEKSLQEKIDEKTPPPARLDPRLARRPAPSDAPDTTAGNPLGTILSALQIPPKPNSSEDKSPPQLPDSTTKSDAEEPPSSSSFAGLVPYVSTPDSNNGDGKREENNSKTGNDEERLKRKRHHRSSSLSSNSSREESGNNHHRRPRRSNSPRRRRDRDRDYNRHHRSRHHRHDERRSWGRDHRR